MARERAIVPRAALSRNILAPEPAAAYRRRRRRQPTCEVQRQVADATVLLQSPLSLLVPRREDQAWDQSSAPGACCAAAGTELRAGKTSPAVAAAPSPR